MLREMTSVQLQEWMVFAELEPFDEERNDSRVGMILHALFNINRDRKKKPKPFTLEECTPKFGDCPDAKGSKSSGKRDWRWMKMMAQGLAQTLPQGNLVIKAKKE